MMKKGLHFFMVFIAIGTIDVINTSYNNHILPLEQISPHDSTVAVLKSLILARNILSSQGIFCHELNQLFLSFEKNSDTLVIHHIAPALKSVCATLERVKNFTQEWKEQEQIVLLLNCFSEYQSRLTQTKTIYKKTNTNPCLSNLSVENLEAATANILCELQVGDCLTVDEDCVTVHGDILIEGQLICTQPSIGCGISGSGGITGPTGATGACGCTTNELVFSVRDFFRSNVGNFGQITTINAAFTSVTSGSLFPVGDVEVRGWQVGVSPPIVTNNQRGLYITFHIPDNFDASTEAGDITVTAHFLIREVDAPDGSDPEFVKLGVWSDFEPNGDDVGPALAQFSPSDEVQVPFSSDFGPGAQAKHLVLTATITNSGIAVGDFVYLFLQRIPTSGTELNDFILLTSLGFEYPVVNT